MVMVKKSPSSTDVHVGARVRMRRMMLSMSQEKLGGALGLTFQQVQKYEKGTNRISASKLQEISQILHVPVSFFFEGVPEIDGRRAGKSTGAPSPAYMSGFMASREGLALATAFSQINDAKLRNGIVNLVEQIASTNPNATRSTAK